MQRFRNRIKFYLVGFAIGLVLMYFMFGNRGCSWLPENRVKNMIAEKEILVGDSLKDVLACASVTNDDVYRLLKDDGDVDFSKSKTQQFPKEYWITGTKDDLEFSIVYALFDSTAEVVELHYEPAKNCTSTRSDFHKSAVPLPDADVRAIIESNRIRILSKAECQMKCLSISENELMEFHKTAGIEIDLSEPRQYPNAKYVLRGTIGNRELLVTYIIGENRTRIADITPNDCNCSE